jgi:hypothetical protein
MTTTKAKIEPKNETTTQASQPVRTLMGIIAPNYKGPAMLSSFDPADPESLQLAVAMANIPDIRAENLDGEYFEIVHWMIRGQEYKAEDEDDPRMGVRLTFLDKSGRIMTTSSEAIVRAWDNVIMLRGHGPYEPPIKLGLEPIITAKGRRSYKVSIG